MIAMPRDDSKDDEAEVTPQVISDIIGLVASPVIPPAVIATWTQAERDEALSWAGGEHLHASDNTGVKRVRQPPFVGRALEICASPVTAQLAVERWTTAKEQLERSAAACAEDLLTDTEPLLAIAQDAVTGLLVLLGGREQEPSWEYRALCLLGDHPEGLSVPELAASLRHRPGPSRDDLEAWLDRGRARGVLAQTFNSGWVVAEPKTTGAASRTRPGRREA